MFTNDILYRLRINLRAMVSYILSLLLDPFLEWEAQMENGMQAASTPDLLRTLSELHLVVHHSNRLYQQAARASALISTGIKKV